MRSLARAFVSALGLALALTGAACADELARARALLAAGQAEPALLAVDDALEARPHDARAWDLRARVHEALGDLAAAVEDQGQRLRIEPAPAAGWIERARLRRLRGDAAGALEDLQRALARAVAADQRATLRVAEGELLLTKGRAREAVQALAEAGAGAPPRLLARARACAGDLGGALLVLDRRLAAAPGDGAARLDRALLRALKGDLPGARSDAARAGAACWAVILGADPGLLASARAESDPWLGARARWVADDRASDALIELAAREEDAPQRRERLREAWLLRALAPLAAGGPPDPRALEAARELGLLSPGLLSPGLGSPGFGSPGLGSPGFGSPGQGSR